jgi:hypothetical protein
MSSVICLVWNNSNCSAAIGCMQSVSVNVAANKYYQGQTQIHKTVFLFVAAFNLFGHYFGLHSVDANCNDVPIANPRPSGVVLPSVTLTSIKPIFSRRTSGHCLCTYEVSNLFPPALQSAGSRTASIFTYSSSVTSSQFYRSHKHLLPGLDRN